MLCGHMVYDLLKHALHLSDGISGRIPNFNRHSNGSNADIDALLMMRSSIVTYVHIIDIYAPCIVRSNVWNREEHMKQYCGDNLQNFQDYILSVSDKAFLLLVLVNYTATWYAEIQAEHTKVR